MIERCKLPIAIKFRKKLGYNHNDITVREEISIPEKTIKLFPHENIALNKKFKNRKPNIWFKHHDTTVEVNEGNHENYDTDDEKEKKRCLKGIILILLNAIQTILIFIFTIFWVK